MRTVTISVTILFSVAILVSGLQNIQKSAILKPQASYQWQKSLKCLISKDPEQIKKAKADACDAEWVSPKVVASN